MVTVLGLRNGWAGKLTPVLRDYYLKTPPDATCNLLIETGGGHATKIAELVRNNQGKLGRKFEFLPFLAAEVPYSAVKELAKSPLVAKLWHDATVYAMLDKAAPGLGVTVAQETGYSGKGVVIAILDTGIYPHEDLIKPDNRILAWNDLLKHEKKPYDDNGHGTQIAGIIAGNGYSSGGRLKGMAPGSWLVGIKVLDQYGRGRVSDVIAGLEWCLKSLPSLNIKIINLSLGTAAQDVYRRDPLCRAAALAWRKGITIFSAIGKGNEKVLNLNSPGIYPGIVKVAGLNRQEAIIADDAGLTSPVVAGNPGLFLKPDLVAPDNQITSINIEGDYSIISGASAAAPLAAGCAALILERMPNLNPSQLKQQLIQSAKDLGLGRSLQGAGALSLERVFRPKRLSQGLNMLPSGPEIIGNLLKLMRSDFLKSPVGNELLTNLMGVLMRKLVEPAGYNSPDGPPDN